eukprot:4342226-Pyramimonas_sp.AAC.1
MITIFWLSGALLKSSWDPLGAFWPCEGPWGFAGNPLKVRESHQRGCRGPGNIFLASRKRLRNCSTRAPRQL